MVNLSLLDLLTGGQTSKASDALAAAQAAFGGIKTPTEQQLTLPELQKYVNAGVLTPAQAIAYLQKSNAYDQATGSQTGREAEMSALSKLQDISESGGMDAEAQAALAKALNQAQIQEQGMNSYILDQMAQKGIPTSLMGASAQMANNANQAQNTYLAGTQAAGDAEQRALQALAESGTLGGNIEQQTFGEQAQKAAAQNAINQWNAQNQTQNSQFNATNQQAANVYNTQNAQNVANQNTGLANYRTQYNTQVPQQVFNNAIQKAQGQSGVAANQANQATQAGQQQAGLIAGLIGGASQIGASAAAPMPMYAGYSQGGEVPMEEGGSVPGRPRVAGDSQKNDVVHARLSPQEIVLPRSVTTSPNAPNLAKGFVQHLLTQKRMRPPHPEDVATVLSALSHRRENGL